LDRRGKWYGAEGDRIHDAANKAADKAEAKAEASLTLNTGYDQQVQRALDTAMNDGSG
jgi:hypothetical protein